MFSRMLSSLSMTTGFGKARSITFRVGEPQKDEDVPSQLELRDSLLQAYSHYVQVVPVPTVHLVVSPGRYFDRRVVEGIADIISKGGDIALESEGKHTFSGLKLNVFGTSDSVPDGVAFLQNLALNLPRLAYESNKDETYFRAKLALLLQTGINALNSRKDHVRDSMKRGLLPALSQIPVVSSLEEMPYVVNLVGLGDAISNLMSEREALTRHELALKILDTASRVTAEKSAKIGDRGLVSVLHSDGFERLTEIDGEKYGRSQELRQRGYQEGLLVSDQYDDKAIKELNDLCKASSGGLLVSFRFAKDASEGLNFGNIVAGLSGKIPFVRFFRNPEICKKCGMKVFNGGRCTNCKSTSLIALPVLL